MTHFSKHLPFFMINLQKSFLLSFGHTQGISNICGHFIVHQQPNHHLHHTTKALVPLFQLPPSLPFHFSRHCSQPSYSDIQIIPSRESSPQVVTFVHVLVFLLLIWFTFFISMRKSKGYLAVPLLWWQILVTVNPILFLLSLYASGSVILCPHLKLVQEI